MRHFLGVLLLIGLVGRAVVPAGAQSDFPVPTGWENTGFLRVLDPDSQSLLSGLYRRGGLNAGASTFSGFNDLLLHNPNSVQSIEVTVTLLDASATPEITTFPRAGIEGFFYWNGTGSGDPTDQTGHVTAGISLAYNVTTGLPEARYFVLRCNDFGCNTQTTIASAVIAPVSFFQPHRLLVSYDGAAFSFAMDGQPGALVSAPDTTRLPPTNQYKALRTRLVVPPVLTASASVLARFEDVSVNGTHYDNFSNKTLPSVRILPASETFSSLQHFDIVIMAETTVGDPISQVRLFGNGVDITPALASAVQGSIAFPGGVTYRFPNVPATILGLDTPAVLAVEVTTQTGAKARGFSIWKTVQVNE